MDWLLVYSTYSCCASSRQNLHEMPETPAIGDSMMSTVLSADRSEYRFQVVQCEGTTSEDHSDIWLSHFRASANSHFMSIVMTEVAVTPHNIRQGGSAVSVMSAYRSVVQNRVSPLCSKMLDADSHTQM